MSGFAELKQRLQHLQDAAVKGQALPHISNDYRNYLQGRASMAANIITEIEQMEENDIQP